MEEINRKLLSVVLLATKLRFARYESIFLKYDEFDRLF